MENKSEAPEASPEGTEQFTVGDRVWVNGVKPGIIQYIGETQFAPGEWVGVMLDEPVGKNDGSVAGVRYFHCKSKHGVFARAHRLTREFSNTLKPGEGTVNSNLANASRNNLSGSKSTVSSIRGIPPCSSASSPKSVASRASISAPKFKVGDYVIVNATSGVKSGVLRYLGSTDFAAGDWAGVELDEPVGKNDGSVAGKRYFECKMKYGLFAPVHKVSKAGGVMPNTRASPAGSTPLSRHAGSYESLNSSVSSTSSSARARVKLGVTALTSTQKSTHSAATTVMATNAALQEALKEKEEHIEQLLKERDIERAEVARAAARADEAEQQYVQLQAEFNRILEENEQNCYHLKQTLELSERQLKDALAQLEDERRKVEDLQFRIEEESIIRSDLEAQFEKHKEHVKNLEKLLQEEQQRSEHFSKEQEKLDLTNEMLSKYKNELDGMKDKLMKSEVVVKSLEDVQEQNSQVQKKQLEEIDNLNLKISTSEVAYEKISGEFKDLKTLYEELAKKTKDSDEIQNKLLSEKQSLEQHLSQVIQSSGDSSQQLKNLSDELKTKKGLFEKLEQEMKAKVDDLNVQHKQEFDAVNEKHSQEIKNWQSKMDMLRQEQQKFQETVRNEVEVLKGQKNALVQEKDNTIETLKKETETRDNLIAQLRDQLKEISAALQKTKDESSCSIQKVEEQLKQLQTDKEYLVKEKDKALAEQKVTQEKCAEMSVQLSQLLKEREQQQKTVHEREQQVTALNAEMERLQTEFAVHKKDLCLKLEESKVEREAMQQMHQELAHHRDSVAELQKILDDAERSRASLRQEAATLQSTLKEMAEEHHLIEDLKKRETRLISEFSNERESLQKTVEKVKSDLVKKEEEVVKLKEEVTGLKGKESQSAKFAAMIEALQQEKKVLESKVVAFQVATKDSHSNANIADSGAKKLEEEKESLQSQVGFLNSIIVDMQKKNDELKSRVQILEMGDVLTENDVNLNGVKTVAPRLFCDICDSFDLHDTEDCPHQATGDDEEIPPHSRHHGQRNQERPYCQTCESFGHWAEECDNETY